MRLRNKHTGDIVEVLTDSIAVNVLMRGNDMTGYYTSLTEMNAEWEDVPEEPKDHYYIDYDGDIMIVEALDYEPKIKEMKQIGNYFETREEAEKTVENLKAWKRTKDKGFRFVGVRTIGKVIDFDIPVGYYRAYFDENVSNEKALELYNDLLLVFGDNK